MTPHGIMPLPSKVAADLAAKVKSGEYKQDIDYMKIGDHICVFVRGNTVVSLMSVDSQVGHQKKDVHEAKRIKDHFALVAHNRARQAELDAEARTQAQNT